VALNGPLVRLGTFSDIENHLTRQDVNSLHRIGVGWTLDCAARSQNRVSSSFDRGWQFAIKNIAVDFSFDTWSGAGPKEVLELHPSLYECTAMANFTDAEEEGHQLLIHEKRASRARTQIKYDSTSFEDMSRMFDNTISSIDDETKKRILEFRPMGEILSCLNQNFFPIRLVVRYDRNKHFANIFMKHLSNGPRASRRYPFAGLQLPKSFIAQLSEAAESAQISDAKLEDFRSALRINGDKISAFLERLKSLPFSSLRSFRTTVTAKFDQLAKSLYCAWGQDKTIIGARSDILVDAWEHTESYFKFSVLYLGPLRDEPKPSYPLQVLSSPTDVGPKGELTAAVLHLNEKLPVVFVSPEFFSGEGFEPKVVEVNLRDAVVSWLAYLGVAVDFSASEKGKLGHEVQVKTSEAAPFQDLTNVGVGVSQILPIVVTCLLAEPGSTIILEQPELHLHPAVQARLADFFVSMIFLGKQCIIETHGEYLIERIRLRIVDDQTDKILNKIKLYFFEQERGVTSYRQVMLTKFGAIKDWPKDFFDQSQKESERIVMSALKRRKREQSPQIKD
jgi:AAA ATPase domain/Protein of unknown function (DUF3696)